MSPTLFQTDLRITNHRGHKFLPSSPRAHLPFASVRLKNAKKFCLFCRQSGGIGDQKGAIRSFMLGVGAVLTTPPRKKHSVTETTTNATTTADLEEDLTQQNGKQLIDFCLESDCVIGNTIFHHSNILKLTWKSPDGSSDVQLQIDYILIIGK